MSCCSIKELEFIATNKSTQRYQKGQVIYHQGNQALGLLCIRQGKVKVCKTGGDNKEQIVHLARQGDVLGFRALLAGSRYSSSAVALDDCIICLVPRPDFLHLLQSNMQFANALLHLLAKALGQAEEQLLHLAYKPVRERLAGALLLLQRTFGEEGQTEAFSISLSREDVASLVGTAKETVSRLLTEFKDAGIIATKGSQITLLDTPRLLEISTFYD